MADLNTYKVSRYRSICEVHREIFDKLEHLEGAEEAIVLLEEAFGMGQRMSKKLIEMNKRTGDERKGSFLPQNPNFRQSMKHRRGRKP